jgi:NDP-hexose 4-ketoreductase
LKTVLILGKNGKLGSALQRFWSACPADGLEYIWLGREDLDRPVPEAAAVVALWGVTHGDSDALARNVALAEAARVLAKAAGAARVLHLSSAAVYGAGEGVLNETAPMQPMGAYGQAKADMEARIALFGDRPRNCVLRLANVAGCDSIFRTLAEGRVPEIDRFDDGQGPLRSYIGVPEFARVLEALLTLPLADLPAVLNVAQPSVAAMNEICEAAGTTVRWIPQRAGAVQKVELDVSALSGIVALPEVSAVALVESWRRFGGWA